jgi:hypothetical protein
VSRATACRYAAEAADVLPLQAPDLPAALERQHAGLDLYGLPAGTQARSS